MRYLLLLLLFGALPAWATGEKPLFPFCQQGRWGFLDAAGVMSIPARFAQVQAFSEGLAAVREAGRYGYIDLIGRFVLPPAYERATPFHAGRAAVSQQGRHQLIDRQGRRLPASTGFARLEWLPGPGGGGVWVGVRADNHRVPLGAQGQPLTSAAFRKIEPPASNRLVVRGPAKPRRGDDEPADDYGLLDQRGRWVVPYGRFDYISNFRDGLATATLRKPAGGGQPAPDCIIDTTGRVLARLPGAELTIPVTGSEFSDGTAPIRVGTDGSLHDNSESFPAVMDRDGRLLFRQPALRQLSAFAHGRAWAREADRQSWYLLNKAGQRLNTVPVVSRLNSDWPPAAPTFAGGVELVELADGYAAMDSLGRIVKQIAAPDFVEQDPYRLGDLLVFATAADSLHPARMGFWNWRTGLLLAPRFAELGAAGYVQGLLAVAENNRWGYVNEAGDYVWQQPASGSAPLNVDYQRRSFYPVASAPLPRYAGFGGWARSGNLPRPVLGPPLLVRALQLRVAAAATAAAFAPGVDEHLLTIANTTADTVVFDAQDSSLFLQLQALDAQGKWRPIEYTPGSFCGNSYHEVYLAPGQSWQLTVPAYEGEFKTQLRARLLIRQGRGRQSDRDRELFSNSFAGSINPAQLWNEQGHTRQSLMDPYVN